MALAFVSSLVANPGIVKARMSLRGRPSRSIARAATISACVESRPPETPITSLGWPIALQPLLEPGDLDVVGLVAVLGEPGRVVGHEREAVERAPQADVARGGGELEGHRAEVAAGRGGVRRLSSKVPVRSRSSRSRSRSTSATVRRGPSGNRSVSASSSPIS